MYLEKQNVLALIEAIKSHDTIIIHRHVRPDPDAIGSQLGLKHLIAASFPQKKVLAAGTISKGLAFLGHMDAITMADYQDALVIITDTANQARIDGENYQKGKTLIKIDHHPEIDCYGDIQIVYPQASSCSEIITLIARENPTDFTMTSQTAKLLYAGIVGDTGRFLFDSTTSLTHELTSYLYNFDLNAYEINDQFQLKTPEEFNLIGYSYNHINLFTEQVAFIDVSQETIKAYQATEEQTNVLVNLPAMIKGVLVWVTFVEQEGNSGLIRCRIRSKGPSINQIAEKFQGGGHPKASGANVYSQEDKELLLNHLAQAAQAFANNLI